MVFDVTAQRLRGLGLCRTRRGAHRADVIQELDHAPLAGPVVGQVGDEPVASGIELIGLMRRVDAIEDVADEAAGEALELAVLGPVLAAGALEVADDRIPSRS